MKQFETVGEKLKSLRKARGRTLKNVADSTDLSISFLSEIERGVVDPSLKTLSKLSKAYGITVSDLLHDVL